MLPPSQLDHIGIAVRSIDEASRFYRDGMGLRCTGIEEVLEQKVRVAFFPVGDVRIELVEPTAADSPIARFLEKRGPGLHHVAYRVDDLPGMLAALKAAGVRLIDETPRPGAHGMQIAFVHPSATAGVLTELCEPASK
jgi:methylmalonyl-CoA/ethylmalonyl-CoA epimerase